MLRIRYRTQLYCHVEKRTITTFRNGDCRNLVILKNCLIHSHQIWCELWSILHHGGIVVNSMSNASVRPMSKISTLISIQDGGCRHLWYRKTVAKSLLFNQSSPNSVGMLWSWSIMHRLRLKVALFPKVKMAAATILDLEKTVAIPSLFNQSSLSLIGLLWIRLRTHMWFRWNALWLTFRTAVQQVQQVIITYLSGQTDRSNWFNVVCAHHQIYKSNRQVNLRNVTASVTRNTTMWQLYQLLANLYRFNISSVN